MRASLFDMRIKLRHISCMIEVTRQGGVVAASHVLGMSQPAVSKSVAELEKILNTKLFDRSGRSLKLTREGEIFAQHAIGAAAALRAGVEGVDAAQTRRNSVRIGAMSSVETSIIPRAISAFLRGPFECNILIETGSARQLLHLLRDGQLDFYAGRLPDPGAMDGLQFEKLYADSVDFVVRPSHPLTYKSVVDYADLMEHTLIMPPREAIGRQIVDGLLIAAGVGKPKREIQTLSKEIARAFALQSDAIWAISRSVVSQDLRDGALVSLKLDTSNSQGPIGVIKRSDDRLTVSSLAMIDAIREEVANQQMHMEPF